MRDRFFNLTVALASLAIGCLVLELVVFRFVLLASDVPANVFVDGVVRYAPGQTGTWRVADEIAAPYSINAAGWNSGHADYPLPRRNGVLRIAVVGDSYVEALQVRYTDSLAEQLERRLGPDTAEVFRFAVSGAPLSQYLHIVEREAVRYRPDIVAVVMVHNDFDESFRRMAGRYASSFLKLRVAAGAVTGETLPAAYRPTWRDWLRRTATARYLYYRWRVTPETVAESVDRLLGGAVVEPCAAAPAPPDPDVRAATDHVFARLAALAARHGFRLLVVMDGVRDCIYRDLPVRTPDLNLMVAGLAAARGIDFIDMHQVFAADWAKRRRRFEFAADAHWNAHAHLLAAEAIHRRLLSGRDGLVRSE